MHRSLMSTITIFVELCLCFSVQIVNRKYWSIPNRANSLWFFGLYNIHFNFIYRCNHIVYKNTPFAGFIDFLSWISIFFRYHPFYSLNLTFRLCRLPMIWSFQCIELIQYDYPMVTFIIMHLYQDELRCCHYICTSNHNNRTVVITVPLN